MSSSQFVTHVGRAGAITANRRVGILIQPFLSLHFNLKPKKVHPVRRVRHQTYGETGGGQVFWPCLGSGTLYRVHALIYDTFYSLCTLFYGILYRVCALLQHIALCVRVGIRDITPYVRVVIRDLTAARRLTCAVYSCK